MALAELTRGSVEKALEEATHLGRDGFLSKYGFKPAKKYFVKWKGALYDSKAIAGVAYGHLPGKTAFGPKDFTGGEKNVGNHLQRLGFEMSSPEERNPSWTRDELILALELYVRFKGKPSGKDEH